MQIFIFHFKHGNNLSVTFRKYFKTNLCKRRVTIYQLTTQTLSLISLCLSLSLFLSHENDFLTFSLFNITYLLFHKEFQCVMITLNNYLKITCFFSSDTGDEKWIMHKITVVFYIFGQCCNFP